MSYKLNEQRISPGGLNVLVPADQNPRRAALTDLVGVPQGESLDLTDWWAASEGRLEQAPQFVLASVPSVTNPQNSILQADGRIYYSDGVNLRQIGRIGESPIDSGYDGYPLGMISFQGYAWFMNRALQRKDDGTTVTDWTVAAPPVPTLADNGYNGFDQGLLSKPYVYYITWIMAGLGETQPSPPATITPAVDFSEVEITRPTIPAAATGWNIYREVPPGGAPGDGVPYLLNQTPIIPLATGYQDSGNGDVGTGASSDTALLTFGVIMEADHDPAPPARIVANQSYNGRIVVANSAAHPNRIWFTQALQPSFFRGSGNPNGGDWVDVGTDAGDEIRALIVRPGMLVIYRAKSIWVHLLDFADPNKLLQPAAPDIGVVGPRAVVSTGIGDYFVGPDGVYRFNNDWPEKLSGKVEPIFRGLATENFPVLGTAFRSQCAIGHRLGRLFVSYPNTSGLPAATLVCHLASGRWFADSVGYSAFLDTGTQFLAASGGVFALEAAYNSSNTLLAYQSQYHDSGLPDRLKTWADLVFEHNTQGVTLSIVCRQNKNANPTNDSFTLITFSSSTHTKSIFPLVYPAGYAVSALVGKPIKSFNLSIRITGNGAATGAPILIDSPILLHYYVEARVGKTFDSGNTNHGLEGVGTIDQIELDIDSSDGAATLLISSDIPAGVMADRTSGGIAIAQSTGRQILRLQLATPIDGRLFRHQISSTTDFGLYGYRVRILPIGVYADGAQSDFWYTEPLSAGV